ISSMEWAPMTLVPLASLARKSSTFETVRLKAATVKPWSFMFKIRFWPITASPITAISALGSMLSPFTGMLNDTSAPGIRQWILRQGVRFSVSAAQLEARIGLQHGLQAGPLHLVHFIERVKID